MINFQNEILSRAQSICTLHDIHDSTPQDCTQVMGSIEATVDNFDENDENLNSNALSINNQALTLPQSDISILVESPRDARFSHFDPRQL